METRVSSRTWNIITERALLPYPKTTGKPRRQALSFRERQHLDMCVGAYRSLTTVSTSWSLSFLLILISHVGGCQSHV